MLFCRNILWLAIALWVSACASQLTPTSQAPAASAIHQQHLATLSKLTSFSLKGRLGVITQQQGFTGGIDWQHQMSADNIDVFSPLGGKVANIAKNPNGVTLTDQKNRSISAQDAESLTEMTLGFRLPLTGLADWVLGRPAASKIVSSTWDEKGRLVTLKQDDWDIAYENYALNNGIDLPNKVILKSEKANMKLLIENWVSVTN